MRNLIRLSALLACVCFSTGVSGADIKRSNHPLYGFVLEGPIVAGDYDKLRKLIEDDSAHLSTTTAPAPVLFIWLRMAEALLRR
jgi:hypothetical protein